MKKIIIINFHWGERYEYTIYAYLVTEKKKDRPYRRREIVLGSGWKLDFSKCVLFNIFISEFF